MSSEDEAHESTPLCQVKFAPPPRLLGCSLPSGSIPAKSAVFQIVPKTHEVQVAAICKIVQGKKLWVGTDEWTSDRGTAIANIVIGCNGKTFVVDSVHVPCRGVLCFVSVSF